jgi:hypothetical protein
VNSARDGVACTKTDCEGSLWPMAGSTDAPTFWVRVRPGKGWACSTVAPRDPEERARGRRWRCPDCASIYRAVEGVPSGYAEA